MPHGEPNPSPAVATPHWRIALDTGGTFTDLVGVAPDGSVVRAKVPSDGTLVATIEAVGGREAGGLESSSSGGSNARSVDASGDAAAGGSHPRQPERGRPARGSTADAGTGDPRLLRVRWPAGLRIPDGLLAGWSASSAQASVGVEWNAGDSIRLVEAWPSACGAGEPLRLVPPAGLVDAPRLGMHLLTGTPWSERLPDAEIRLSTTRGTNALLEGRGAKVGVLVSDALEGVVTIGDQTRAELFARVPSPRRQLAHAVRALEERTLAGGETRLRADDAAIADAASDLVRRGCDTLVVSLAHALVDGGREEEIAATLRAQGFHARA
ncbi:MAG: Acetone carboxylase beta subunit, partial [Planctomycetota bacterium]